MADIPEGCPPLLCLSELANERPPAVMPNQWPRSLLLECLDNLLAHRNAREDNRDIAYERTHDSKA